MSKRPDLKSKLKAADRRRRRRSAPAVRTAEPPETSRPKVDLTGLIATTILEFVDSAGSQVHDAAVVSALRSCLNVSRSSGTHSIPLLQRLDAVQQRPDVDVRAYRLALRGLLDTAAQHRDAEDPVAFIRYLGLLAD